MNRKEYKYSDGSGSFEFDIDLALRFLDPEIPDDEICYDPVNDLFRWSSTKEGRKYWYSFPPEPKKLRQDEELREKIIWYLKEAGVKYEDPIAFVPPTSNQGVYSQGCQSKC